ncbi:hypothetical protein [Maridesulfovibrio hydrothermalis]|uniref:Uncharacterized protein n=1 Tax=Maridesulfovibrio hydrothermalis AM13 = DSM 14728 TaxID=1121451 RepID=L0RHN4_9BACT|nr:hypothetical protein [Maridesulfovibrio hydrothermalis]CCO25091.1 conserved exported protein of unknown function [Maridesulfovibrio hydrothermalis AM13 = DSM 14728]
MIYIVILILIGAIGTVLACKSITANFDAKSSALAEKDQNLHKEQDELRKRRKELKRELEELKKSMKQNTKKEELASVSQQTSLKDWLLDTGMLESSQYRKAQEYAEEKNMNMLSALLTLNMVSVDTYEKAKKKKLG